MATVWVEPGEDVQAAAQFLATGDTLAFKAGHHYGRLDVPIDNVTIAGEPGAILDGTMALAAEWELATDSDNYCSLAGSGTWRVHNPWQVWMLTDSNGALQLRIDSDYVNARQTSGYYYMTAYEAMIVPDGARPGPDYGAEWWAGIESLSVYNRTNGYLYLKYRDGRRPGKMRWSGGVTDHRDPPRQDGSTIFCYGREDVVISSLDIRGCVDGIAIYDSSNVDVEDCRFQAFDYATRVFGACQDVKILRSYFNQRDYGCDIVTPIAKISSEDPYPDARLTSYHQYAMRKFFKDESDSTHGSACTIANGWNDSTQETYRPRQVEFAHNHVECCVFGVDMFGGDGIDLGFNRVHNMVDMPFQRSPNGGRNIKVHDNETYEAGYALMRWHLSNEDAGENYIYNNRCSSLDKVSDFMFHGGTYDGSVPDSRLRVFHYHNTFSGGNTIWMLQGLASFPGFVAVNNLLSHVGNTSNAGGDSWKIGGFDWNAMSASLGAGGEWYGQNNIVHMEPLWPVDQIEHGFVVPEGHYTKGAGVDVTKPFVINGVTYGPLPGFESGYSHDIGWINRGDIPDGGGQVATLTVTPVNVVTGGTCEVAWTGSTKPYDWIALFPAGAPNNDDAYLDWHYTSCEHEALSAVPSGICPWPMKVEPGEYEFRMFADNSFTLLDTCEVTVLEENIDPEPEPDWIEVMISAWVKRADITVPAKARKRKVRAPLHID